MRECESVLYGAARTVSGVSNPFLKRLFIIAFVGPMVKHCKKETSHSPQILQATAMESIAHMSILLLTIII